MEKKKKKKDLEQEEKKIDKLVKKIVDEYGEVLRRLAKE